MSNDAPSTSLEIDSNVKIEKGDTSESVEVSDKPSKGNAEESELDFKIDVDKWSRQNAWRIYLGFKENEGDVYVEFPQGKNKYISEELRIVNVDEVIREIEGGQGRDNNALQQAAEIFAKNVMEERDLEIDLANVDIILTVARHAPIKTVLEVKQALADQGFRRVFHRMENNK